MYIKIERGDKTQMHHAKSYWTNECGNGFDLNIERVDDAIIQERVEQGEEVHIYVMNDQGKTIDKILG